MRRAIPLLLVVLWTALISQAQPAPATKPAPAEPKPVLVLPFVSPSDAKYQSIGRSVQQDLVSALAADLRGRAIAPAGAAPAADATAALKSGREAQASAVIFGQVQVTGNVIRLSGQVLDVATGRSLGSLRQTGPIDNLFSLQDALKSEVDRALPAELLNLRGLAEARGSAPMRTIYLPGDPSYPAYNNQPIDGGAPAPSYTPYTLVPPAPAPPYSATSGTYPWRISTPYSHLFTYDFDPDPSLPIPGAFYPDRFGARGGGRPDGRR